jgi:hypothetical protein
VAVAGPYFAGVRFKVACSKLLTAASPFDAGGKKIGENEIFLYVKQVVLLKHGDSKRQLPKG